MSLQDRIRHCLQNDVLDLFQCQGDLFVQVPRDRIVQCLEKLRDEPGLEFDFLVDVVGVDNSALHEKEIKAREKALAKEKEKAEESGETGVENEPVVLEVPPRFDVIYLLLSLKSNERLAVKVKVPEEDPEVDTVTTIWRAADWPEREIFDFLGIRFRGHHNLKRLMMWEGFGSYPLRKDYPLQGKGEERHLDYDE